MKKSLNRIAIFCFHDRFGHVDSADLYLLNELKQNADTLIVVVNGELENKLSLSDLADHIYVRENHGLDGGAYKSIIFHEEYAGIIKNCEELILCNNSFYGPLIPLSNIFDVMSYKDVDFWGMSSYEQHLMMHLQSYFLVFRRSILSNKEFYLYFQEHIQVGTVDYSSVCASFENGLFECLIDAGYKYGAYKKKIKCDNYKNPYGSLKIDKLPIIKKKMFSQEFYSKNSALDTLKYTSEEFPHYNINLILESIERRYERTISSEDISNHLLGDVKEDWREPVKKRKRNEIKQFIEKNKIIYIYGAGKEADSTYKTFISYENNSRFQGFIISDNQEIKKDVLYGYPIYKLSQIEDDDKTGIIVGLGKVNSKTVKEYLVGYKNVVYLWDEQGV